MKKTIRLTESELIGVIKRIINENKDLVFDSSYFKGKIKGVIEISPEGYVKKVNGRDVPVEQSEKVFGDLLSGEELESYDDLTGYTIFNYEYIPDTKKLFLFPKDKKVRRQYYYKLKK